MNIADKIIDEPLVGIHHNPNYVYDTVKNVIVNETKYLNKLRDRFKLEGTPIRVNLLASNNPFTKKK